MSDHKNVIDRVRALLTVVPVRGFKASDINIADFPFEKQPPFGLVLSPLRELQGESLNEATDIGYPVQIMRAGVRSHSRFGFDERDDWRTDVFNRFNRVRIGEIDCELITRASFDDLTLKSAWDNWGLDASVINVTCWVRKPILKD